MAAVSSGVLRVWDLPLRLFHWLLVAAIAVAFLSAEEGSPLNSWHVRAGWVAGILILFRIIWGFVGGEHSRFSDFIRPSRIAHHLSLLVHGRAEPSLGHNPLGAVAVILLLALTAATVWTGAFAGEAGEGFHELIGWTLLAMIAAHVVAVAIMSRLEKESLIRAMIGGTKRKSLHPGAKDAYRPRPLGVLIALFGLLAAIFGVLRYDPQAFAPRGTEVYEERGDQPSIDQPRSSEERED